MEDVKIFRVEKPWGNFLQFTHNISSTVKILTLKPNEELSLQSHNKRKEFWHVISGSGYVEVNGQKDKAEVGFEKSIDFGDKHRLIAGEEGVQVLEIALGDFDENGDIIRYEDKYGRV